MSTTAPSSASPSVVRSHSTTSRPPSYRPVVSSDNPHRTRSVAVRPATAHQSSPQHHHHHSQHYHSHSHSKSQSYDRRPPSNQAVFDNIARRDLEHPVSTRRSNSRERSQERPSTAYRAEPPSNKHHRNLSVQGHQRDSIDIKF